MFSGVKTNQKSLGPPLIMPRFCIDIQPLHKTLFLTSTTLLDFSNGLNLGKTLNNSHIVQVVFINRLNINQNQ